MLAGSLLGCTTRLDINPAFDIPAGEALVDNNDLRNALYSAYAAMGSRYTLGGNMRAWGDVMSDHVIWNPASPHVPGEFSIYNRQLSPEDTLIARTWEYSWKAINRANEVIYAVDNSGNFSLTGEVAEIYGEAHFVRGVMFFELARWFGTQYSDATAGLPSIPLRTKPAREQEFTEKSTTQQVYDQVIADLNKAATLLPLRETEIDQLNYGKATAGAAKAVLARVLFQMGTPSSYQRSLALINEVLGPVFLRDSGRVQPIAVPTLTELTSLTTQTTAQRNYPANYPLFPNTGPGSLRSLFNGTTGRGVIPSRNLPVFYEPIFQILNSESFTSAGDYIRRFSYRGPAAGRADLTAPRYVPSTNFVTSDDYNVLGGTNRSLWRFSDDRRNRDWFTQNVSISAGTPINVAGADRFPTIKYAFSPSADQFSDARLNLIYIRSAELMLDRAEILAASGNPDDAVRAAAELAFLKRRAGVIVTSTAANNRLNNADGLTDVARNDVQLLRREIELERLRELSFEGERLHDLRRRGLDVPAGERPGWEIPKDRGILPIPATETRTNRKV